MPYVTKVPSGAISMMEAESRLSAGSREPSLSRIERVLGQAGRVHDRRRVEADGRRWDGEDERQDPATAYQHRDRDPTGRLDVSRLPAVGCNRHVQPPADGLVDDAAGTWLARWGHVAEDGERCLGKCFPHMVAGQAAASGPHVRFAGYRLRRHGWTSFLRLIATLARAPIRHRSRRTCLVRPIRSC